MKTETIEWFTPEEKLPDGNMDLIGISLWGEIGEYFFNDGSWSKPVFKNADTPMFWAYAPKGPQ